MTCEEVVQAYISRVQDVNPLINAMVDHRFEAAILDARYVDRLIQSGVKTEEQLRFLEFHLLSKAVLE